MDPNLKPVQLTVQEIIQNFLKAMWCRALPLTTSYLGLILAGACEKANSDLGFLQFPLNTT